MSDAHTPGPDKQKKDTSQDDDDLFDPSLFDEEEEASFSGEDIELDSDVSLDAEPRGEDELGNDLEGIMERLETTDANTDLSFSPDDDASGDDDLLELNDEQALPGEDTLLEAESDDDDMLAWDDEDGFTPIEDGASADETLAGAADQADDSELEPGAVDDWLDTEMPSALDGGEMDFEGETSAASELTDDKIDLAGDEAEVDLSDDDSAFGRAAEGDTDVDLGDDDSAFGRAAEGDTDVDLGDDDSAFGRAAEGDTEIDLSGDDSETDFGDTEEFTPSDAADDAEGPSYADSDAAETAAAPSLEDPADAFQDLPADHQTGGEMEISFADEGAEPEPSWEADTQAADTSMTDYDATPSEGEQDAAAAFDDTPDWATAEDPDWAAAAEASADDPAPISDPDLDAHPEWASAADLGDTPSFSPDDEPLYTETADSSPDEAFTMADAEPEPSPWEDPAHTGFGADADLQDSHADFMADSDDRQGAYAPAQDRPLAADQPPPPGGSSGQSEGRSGGGGAAWILGTLLVAGAGGGFWYGKQLSEQIGALESQVTNLDQETRAVSQVGSQVERQQSDLENLRQRVRELTQSADSFNIPTNIDRQLSQNSQRMEDLTRAEQRIENRLDSLERQMASGPSGGNIEAQLSQNLQRMDDLIRTEQRIENRLNSLERQVTSRAPTPGPAPEPNAAPGAETAADPAETFQGGTLLMLQEQIQDLRKDITELRRQDPSADLEALDDELTQALNTIQAAEKSGAVLREELVSVRKELGLLKDDTASLEQTAETVDRRLGDIASRVAMMDDNLESLASEQQRLAATAADSETLAQTEQALRAELANLQTELAEFQGEGVQARLADADRAAALDRRLQALAAQMALMDEQMENLASAQTADAEKPQASTAVRITDSAASAPAEPQSATDAQQPAAAEPTQTAEPAREGAQVAETEQPAAAEPATDQPAEAEGPAATEPAAPASGWGVNLLSFNTRAGAEEGRQALRQQHDLDTVVREARVNGATWYRLRVEGFTDSAAAKRFLAEHANQAPFNGAWISKNG